MANINPDALYLCLERDLDAVHSSTDPLASPTSFAKQAIRSTFFKKFEDRWSAASDAKAQETFLSANSSCREWKPRWEELFDDILVGAFRKHLLDRMDEINSRVGAFSDLFDLGRHGPGASIMALGQDFYTKTSSSVISTTSSRLSEEYLHYVSRFNTWSRAEAIRFGAYGEPIIVPGSRLSFVPKNEDTSRTICVEPTLNMFCQLGYGTLIEGELGRSFGIDLSVQPDKNRDLAWIGSITGEFSTLDLKSASDSISLRMLEHFLPERSLFWIKKLRSPRVETPNGAWVELDMVSSMGNGFTFPLQTLIFSCVVASVYELYQIPLVRPRYGNRGNFAVFGDDIIVKTGVARHCVRLLNLLGFTVNKEKSFLEGPFRESCGSDYFLGQNVRGVYIKSLKTPQNRVSVINRLNEWTAVTGIPLPRTVGHLLKSLRDVKVPLVPLAENADAGLKVPFSYLSRVELDEDTQSAVYYRWVSRAATMRLGDGFLKLDKGLKKRIFNPYGLLLSFLHGSLVNHSISVRLGANRYGRKRG